MIVFLIIGKRSFNFTEFIENGLTISNSYNHEWWFLNTYIKILIFFPFIYKLVEYIDEKNIVYILLAMSMVIICEFYSNVDSIMIVSILLNFISYQGCFILGCIFCKMSLFDKVYYKINSSMNTIVAQIFIIILCIIVRDKSYIVDFIMVPILIYATCICLEKLKLKNLFIYLGNHSTNIWLTHSFFYYYYFQNITFYPKYSVLIVIWLVVLSLISSYCINYIISLINKFSSDLAMLINNE